MLGRRDLTLASTLLCAALAVNSVLADADRASSQAASAPGADAGLRAQARAIFGTIATEVAVNEQQAALGRALFFDTRIAADGKTGCVTCHLAEQWGADGRALSPDARGKLTERNSQTVFNATAQPSLRWRGDRRSAAHQAEDSLKGSLGYKSTDEIVPVLKSLGYEPLFKRAFAADQAPVSSANFGNALEAYQRTLVTPAPFDAYLKGDDAAFTARQKTGLRTFIETGCAGCHSGALFGGTSYQKFGVVRDYWLATKSKSVDVGRFAVTKNEADKYAFRVPSLRNVVKTAPYFHDGSVAQLREAVQIMASVQLGRELDADGADAIVAFLQGLTGAVPAHFAPPAQSAHGP
jgi:cytochrome c peroxidase